LRRLGAEWRSAMRLKMDIRQAVSRLLRPLHGKTEQGAASEAGGLAGAKKKDELRLYQDPAFAPRIKDGCFPLILSLRERTEVRGAGLRKILFPQPC